MSYYVAEHAKLACDGADGFWNVGAASAMWRLEGRDFSVVY